MDRPDISRLNKNRSTYLKLGFVISLSLTVMAFNYTVYDEPNQDYERPLPMEEDELIPVQRTVQREKKELPPLSLKPTDKFIDDEIIFDPEPEPINPKIVLDPVPADPRPMPIVMPDPKPPVLPNEPVVEAPIIFEVVEQMPRFSGCEDMGFNESELKSCSDKKMLEYIYSKVKYPAMARENGIEGTVVASFVVEKDGAISGLKIAREIGGGCGNEILRIVKDMPDWIPGEQRKKKVRVQFNLPIKFTLN
ncbi:MAG: protein TonB [Saprospiraceae bacterium]|jgi:protein TonB